CVASPIPDAPFARLCLHKAGDEQCPSADYAVRFTTFTSLRDERACACTGKALASCGTAVTYFKGEGCNFSPTEGSSGTCSASASVSLTGMGPFTKGCIDETTAVSGTVEESDVVTFCCNK